MSTYRDLRVWQTGMDLVILVYAFTRTLPTEERYGLVSQINRAGLSIPSNVAEGHCRRTLGSYVNHVSIAIGSQGELETMLEVCRRLKLGKIDLLQACEKCLGETGRMLHALHAALERSQGRRRGLVYSILGIVCCIWYLGL